MDYGLLLLGEHGLDRLLKLAHFAEDNQFQHLWYADEKFFRDPYVSLTYLAQHTSRIKLATCVTDPYTRHPALSAMAMASLDEVANGRAVLGIGAGSSGLHAMNLHQTKPVVALREAIGLIQQLWAGETVTVEGEVVSFHGGELNFKARPDIPVVIATSGRQILRLAGEVADGVMLGDLASARVITAAMAEVKRGAERAGRSLDNVKFFSRANLILSDDPAAARAPMRPWIANGMWHMAGKWEYFLNYSPDWEERFQEIKAFIERQGGRPRNVGDLALIAPYTSLVSDDLVRDAALAGTVEEVARQIVEIAGTGVHEVTLYPMALEEQTLESVLERFVSEVLPAVKQMQKEG
ncbi:MAG: LLM class flavin-dependent oxidoreductase [Chloroflexi bacterium]|nr:LLM class flavin-dependent oxidoreductase [Chloroflexota bacterium]